MSRSDLRSSDIRRLLRSAAELELSADAVQKLKWFLYAADHEGNVSLTCRHFGISRSTYLRWASRFNPEDVRSLDEHSRSPHSVREPETDPQVIALITELRKAQPTIGKESIAQILQETRGITVSSSTVGRVIARHGLFFAETPAHQRKRMQYEATHPTKHTEPTGSIPQDALPDSDDLPGYLPAPGITS